MKALTQIKSLLGRLHRDERGAEGLEKILIIGAIVLPLLGVLLAFRTQLVTLIETAWSSVATDAEETDLGNFE